ncbi:hypothetical protein Tco_0127542 [Tanacetum coccineum]
MGATYTLLSHFDDSLPVYEAFCFDIEENSSGSTTSHSDRSLTDYEAFGFVVDHIVEKSSGSTISHSDLSLPEILYDLEDLRAFSNPFVEIPSDESKVHIEVLSVLWGNRLPILDGSLPLSR